MAKINKYIIFQLINILLTLVLCLGSGEIYYKSIYIIMFMAIYVGINLFSLKTITLTPLILFAVALFMFNVGLCLIIVFFPSLNLTTLDIDSQSLYAGIEYSIYSLLAFSIGSLIVFKGLPKKSLEKAYYGVDKLIIGTLILISLPFYIKFTLFRMNLALQHGYLDSYKLTTESGSSVDATISSIFLPMLLASLVIFKRNKAYRTMAIVFVVLNSSLSILLGFRGGSLLLILCLLFVYDRYIKRVNYNVFLPIAAVLLFVIFPIVSQYRGNIDQETISNVKTDNLIASSIREMGGSVLPAAYTMSIVDKENEFRYGRTFLYALNMVLPSQILNDRVDLNQISPAIWLVNTIDPQFASLGGGYGFSPIAEGYLNFGYLGGLIFMCFLGMVISNLSNYIMNSTGILSILLTCYLPNLIFYTRQESLLLFRPLVWFVLIPAVIIVFLGGHLANLKRGLRKAHA